MALRSPIAFHAYWGIFATYIALPNVLGSTTQSSDLQAGDTAYVSGTSALYVCTVATLGAAVWAAVASGGPVVSVEIDFGALPSWGSGFTITDATVTTASRISVWQSGETATGRVGNDQAWDQILLAANPGTGTFTITAYPYPGPVVGKRKICYQVV